MKIIYITLFAATLFGCATNQGNAPAQPGNQKAEAIVSDIYSKSTTTVDWPIGLDPQVNQAVAILESYETDANECAISLKVYGRGKLPENRRGACYKSLELGIKDSRYEQAMKKLLEASKSGEKIDVNQLERGLKAAKSSQRHFAYIKERLLN